MNRYARLASDRDVRPRNASAVQRSAAQCALQRAMNRASVLRVVARPIQAASKAARPPDWEPAGGDLDGRRVAPHRVPSPLEATPPRPARPPSTIHHGAVTACHRARRCHGNAPPRPRPGPMGGRAMRDGRRQAATEIPYRRRPSSPERPSFQQPQASALRAAASARGTEGRPPAAPPCRASRPVAYPPGARRPRPESEPGRNRSPRPAWAWASTPSSRAAIRPR